MDQTQAIEQIMDRLDHLEQAVSQLRSSVSELQPQAQQPQKTVQAQPVEDYPWADKTLLRQEFKKLLDSLGIHRQPVGAERLQRMMDQAGLGSNELSQGIIEMRDE